MRDSNVRFRAPDYAKALGIFLVVFGHVLRGLITTHIMVPDAFWASVDRAIYLFHMPLFFYISGLFFQKTIQRHGYAGVFKRNAFMLLLPLVVWSYLQFSLQYLFSADANIKLSLLDVLTAPFPPRQQFWFLGVLFITTSLVGVLLYLRHTKAILWLVLISFFAIRVFAHDYINTILVMNYYYALLGQFIIHLPFFIMGILMGAPFLNKIPIENIFCFAVIVMALWIEQVTPLAGTLISTISSVLCVLAFYKIFLNLDRSLGRSGNMYLSKLCIFVGMNSMIIYLAHVICAAGYRSALIKVGISGVAPHLLGGVFVGLFAPLLLVPIGLKLRVYYPKISDAVLPVRGSR